LIVVVSLFQLLSIFRWVAEFYDKTLRFPVRTRLLQLILQNPAQQRAEGSRIISAHLFEISDTASISEFVVPFPAASPQLLAAISALGISGWRSRRAT